MLSMIVYDYDICDDNVKLIELILDDRLIKNMDVLHKESINNLCNTTPNGTIHKFINDSKTDVQVGITISTCHKKICIVFRGTDSKKDWFSNIKTYKRKLIGNIRIHAGIYDQLIDSGICNDITESIIGLLSTPLYKDYNIYITGHSLGGALATLYGYLLSSATFNNIIVISFASCKVGNKSWRNAFESVPHLTHYRVTTHRDPITAVPIINYYHVGRHIELYKQKIKLINTHPCLENTIFKCWNIKHHDCNIYYERISLNNNVINNNNLYLNSMYN
jgi:predicted lipase